MLTGLESPQGSEGSVAFGAGEAAEVANVVMWLFSDEAEYVSGALHLIDGALNAG